MQASIRNNPTGWSFYRTAFAMLDMWIINQMQSSNQEIVRFAQMLDGKFSTYLLKMPKVLTPAEYTRFMEMLSTDLRADSISAEQRSRRDALRNIVQSIRDGIIDDILHLQTTEGCRCLACVN
jgi:hypothetical protein